MTIAELIVRLQAEENHNARVVIRGYEDGYNDVDKLEHIPIVLNMYNEWYYGKHGDPRSDRPMDEIALHISA